MKKKKQGELLDRFYELNEKKTVEFCEEKQDQRQDNLESFETYCDRRKQETREFGKNIIDSLTQTFNLIFEDLLAMHEDRTVKQLVKGAEHFKKQLSKMSDEEILKSEYLEEKKLIDFFECNEETIEKIYQVGVRYLEKEDFVNAAKIFSLLILLDPGYSSIWISLGIALKQNRQFEESAEAFKMAIDLDPDSPLPYLHLSICYKNLGQKKDANRLLEEGMQKAQVEPKYKELVKAIKTEQLD